MTGDTRGRLYQKLAQKLVDDLTMEGYAPGDRLPAERELAQTYDVSRPTVREAIIALEVQGIVEVRVGSGAYLVQMPDGRDPADFGVSAFEVTEARLLLESEAAALAAAEITDEELERLQSLVADIERENKRSEGTEIADREFHLTIARATRNGALADMVERLWELRAASPESALLYAKARSANVKPVVEEHSAILDALRSRNPVFARKAMQDHLGAVLESLLFATEKAAIAEAREVSQHRRARFARAIG